MEGEFDEVVVVQGEALSLLIEVAVKDDVPGGDGGVVFRADGVKVLVQHKLIIVGVFKELADLDHVTGVTEGHVTEGEAALLIYGGEHLVYVGVIEDKEALGIAEGVYVLLQDGDAKAVEGVYVAGVVVAGEGVDALAHLAGGLVGEGDAQDAGGRYAKLRDEVGEAPGQGPGLTGARAGDDADGTLGGGHCRELRGVKV